MTSKQAINSSGTQNDSSDTVRVNVTVIGETYDILWNKQIPLLDALLNAGMNVPYSCRRAACGSCACKLEEGAVNLKRNYVLSETHLQQGFILACVAVPVSEGITLNYDEFKA